MNKIEQRNLEPYDYQVVLKDSQTIVLPDYEEQLNILFKSFKSVSSLWTVEKST